MHGYNIGLGRDQLKKAAEIYKASENSLHYVLVKIKDSLKTDWTGYVPSIFSFDSKRVKMDKNKSGIRPLA